MPSPSREDRICAMLDSFAKTVCRNFVRNLRRDEPIRDSHLADEQAVDILEQIGHGDTYPSDFFVLYVDGHDLPEIVPEEAVIVQKIYRLFMV